MSHKFKYFMYISHTQYKDSLSVAFVFYMLPSFDNTTAKSQSSHPMHFWPLRNLRKRLLVIICATLSSIT